MTAPLIAEQLTCGYAERQVLESLSLAVQAGEVLVLLGANGAGKTTLLRALARLLRPSSGAVYLEGQDIWHLGARQVPTRIAVMPQSEKREWPLSVEDAVHLGRVPHRGWLLPFTAQDKQIVENALRATGLCDLRRRPITQLSGGEWRRMVLARALAQQAAVLLLDEPTAGLDLKYQGQVLRLVRRLATEQGLAVVLTLHDLNHASLYGDRLALLAEQSLLAIGTADEVLTAEMIQRAFDIPVLITRHPVYQTPLVVPLANAIDAEAGDGAGEN